jgi:hypothetical protein
MNNAIEVQPGDVLIDTDLSSRRAWWPWVRKNEVRVIQVDLIHIAADNDALAVQYHYTTPDGERGTGAMSRRRAACLPRL